MDVIFDIDGTLADPAHRLHFINDMAYWTSPPGKLPRPNWEAFLSPDEIIKDAPIQQTFYLLMTMLENPSDYRVIFATARKESTRQVTYDWLRGSPECPVRAFTWNAWERLSETKGHTVGPLLYMRPDSSRKPSDQVKRQLLKQIRADGFQPTLVFEDRKQDAAMWRSEGLLCCQVADGAY
jgi:phosphoglycolate phosphatase-like HAD superfamily hydrolase